MRATIRSRLPAAFSADRRWCAALASSTAVHLAVLLVLSGLWPAGEALVTSVGEAIDARWPNDVSHPALPPFVTDIVAPAAEDQPGGSGSASFEFIAAPVEPDVPVPGAASTIPDETGDVTTLTGFLAHTVGSPADSAEGTDAGRGDGAGPARGDHRGGRFFGIEGHGKRFVYVVDRSNSMNHEHDSPSKTRFRRLKVELVRSVGGMTPDMQFFIVFFNNEALPMPASRLQPATPWCKQHFLEWTSRQRAIGRTDPRDALTLAMFLKPDTIYFLTDGRFPHIVEKELSGFRQNQIVIHTFAFGSDEGEEVLRALADNNGGQYHFVP